MSFLSLIESKRDGKSLSTAQIQEFVLAYTRGDLPDYQVSAFLMAIFFRGLTSAETRDLTIAMRDSGDVLEFGRAKSKDPRPLVDKHSTGGVGDKVSLPLAPLLACLGFRVPMISGRGLGITGGTLDKLDSIPGFRTTLEPGEIAEIVQRVGCVICGQTQRMVPADKGLYSLRDVTGTVPSIPLIVASILSKKLAEGLQALVLDVKFGAAAFMPTLQKARELARAMVRLGNDCGVRTRAILSRMESPLGNASGNWLEVKEAVECLEGRGPVDLREIVLECAAQIIVSAGKTSAIVAARKEAAACLESGGPRKRWDEMLAAQGADLDAFRHKLNSPPSGTVVEIRASKNGFVSACNARIVGEAVRDMGGGRVRKDSVLNYEVGIELLAKPGARIKRGEPLLRIHAASGASAKAVSDSLAAAVTISGKAPPRRALIVGVLK